MTALPRGISSKTVTALIVPPLAFDTLLARPLARLILREPSQKTEPIQ